MAHGPATPRRVAGLIAGVAAMAVILQFVDVVERRGSVAATLLIQVRYFTILSNLAVTIVLAGMALGGRRSASPAAIAGLALTMSLVCIVYNGLLRGLYVLGPVGVVADLMLHDLVPGLVLAFWLTLCPKGRLRARDPLLWTIFPLLYLAYALALARFDGLYPYPFMNVRELGWAQTGVNVAGIAIGFVAAGYGLLAFDRWLGRRSATQGSLP